jgi:NAD(P)-dependent dehydrogenase (short-subunit alcohol dehydrogenase family)
MLALLELTILAIIFSRRARLSLQRTKKMAEGKTVSRGKIVERRRPAAAGRALPDPQQYRHLPHRLVDAPSSSGTMSPTARHGLKWWRKRSNGSARVDALVNNAAMFNPRPLIDTSAAEIGAALPGESTWRLSREAVIGPMKAAKARAIVNISSVSGLRNIPVQLPMRPPNGRCEE